MSAEISVASLALGLLLVQTFKAGRTRFKEHKSKSTRVNHLNIDNTPPVDKHDQCKVAYRRKLAAVKQLCKRDGTGGYRELERAACIGHHRGDQGMEEAKFGKKYKGNALPDSEGLLGHAGEAGAKGHRN